ncbi:putative peptidylprolyl isomerase [Helianthus annuus]|nr:putative peptidylprolyl isomerase [Helianthus annuus]KAJ0865938.1 putative peptidylprolyl isomerase [Helianthus annuus]
MSSRTSTSLFGVIGAGVDQDVSSKDNPRVFMDISINGGLTERMIIEFICSIRTVFVNLQLFANVVPRTAENFRVLCTGDKGIGPVTRKPLHYKGTVFHVIRKGFLAEGGDLLGKNDGSCGESIYGESFEDENFLLRHSEPGMLSMAKRGPNTNGSRFYLTFNPVQMLDGYCPFQVNFSFRKRLPKSTYKG